MEAIPDRLISDEIFIEPATTGEFLPNGRKRYREWTKGRREEIRRQLPGIDPFSELTGSGGKSLDGHDPFTSILLCSDDFSPSFKNEPKRIDLQTKDIINELLKTTEVFPSKYSVGSDDEKGRAQNAKRTLHATTLTRNTMGSKARKSGLFPRNQPQRIDQNQIMAPTNTSGIVNVLERRIHVDRLINRKASLYSMLRAWILGDPEAETISPIATIAIQHVRRKTLEDYRKQKPAKQKAFSETFRRLGILEGLKPSKRLHKYPFYSNKKEIRKRHKPHRAKKPWNHLRKQRVAVARKSLWRKGIKI